jgi:RNA polymerase sigma-70 factor (ECF subfamily)
MEDLQIQRPLQRRMAPVAWPVSNAMTSATWLEALRTEGPVHDRAVAALYALLMDGARSEVARRRSSVGWLPAEQLDDIATQAAGDALVAVLGRLDEFRGDSRFTTWAYKFALVEAGTRVRRKAWQHRDVVLDSGSWIRLVESGPDVDARQAELFRALAEVIGGVLTEHQRRVLVALAIDGVPIDVLAERLGTTRGVLYRTLRDARRELRVALVAHGVAVDAA